MADTVGAPPRIAGSRQHTEFGTPDSSSARGCSSAGRAAALQAVGRGFESLHLHQIAVFKLARRKEQLERRWCPTSAILPSRTSIRVNTAWLNRCLVGADPGARPWRSWWRSAWRSPRSPANRPGGRRSRRGIPRLSGRRHRCVSARSSTWSRRWLRRSRRRGACAVRCRPWRACG
jgi:hypothetical protein